MGGHYHSAFMDGTQSEDKTIGRFYGRRRRAYKVCEAEAKAMTASGGSCENSDYEEVLSSRVTYSDSYATLTGIYCDDQSFESTEAAADHFFGVDSPLEKWGSAVAVKVKLTQEEAESEGVKLDPGGYAWAIYANLAC